MVTLYPRKYSKEVRTSDSIDYIQSIALKKTLKSISYEHCIEETNGRQQGRSGTSKSVPVVPETLYIQKRTFNK